MNSSTNLNLRVGDYVDVAAVNHVGRRDSDGGKGYVECLSPNISVQYIVTNLLPPSVDCQRILDVLVEMEVSPN